MEYSLNVRPSACFEILKIVEVSTVEGNSKSYKVEWAPSWVSGAHLLGCEHLIQEFLQQKHQHDISDSNDQYITHCREYQEESSTMFFDNVLKEEVREQYVACTNTYPNDNLYPRNAFHHDGDNNVSRKKLCSVPYNNDNEASNLPNEAMTVPNEAMAVPNEVVTDELYMNNLDIVTEREHNDSSGSCLNENNLNNEPAIVIVKTEEDTQPIELDSVSAIHETEYHHPQQHHFDNPSPYSKNPSMKLPTGQLHDSLFEEPHKTHSVMTYDNPRTIIPRTTDKKSVMSFSSCSSSPPYICSICGKKVSSRESLVGHQSSHTGARPFHCEVCGKDFVHKSNLRRHKIKVHQRNLKPPPPEQVDNPQENFP